MQKKKIEGEARRDAALFASGAPAREARAAGFEARALLVGVTGSPDVDIYPPDVDISMLARPVHVVDGRRVRAGVDLVELDASGTPCRTVETIYEEEDEEDEDERDLGE